MSSPFGCTSCDHINRSHDDQTPPRQRRGRGGTGSQSRDFSHFQDSPSPHSSNHTSPSAAPAPAPLAPAAAYAPPPPGPPGVMSVAELVQQPDRDHLPYLTLYPHGRGQKRFNRSGNGISAWINRMMYSALDKGHPTFTHFPTDKQVLWFRQFAVPKKKGRLVGLGRRSRSAAPSSAPPPYVDPEVLTAQLKDKDDRISALETKMAAQQAGYEAQKRLNEQMMEIMKRMYPNEVFPNIQDP
uniref:Uncharacterized protein n=1 Tax=Brassica oleracea var. oleracea TaxID=109376 RepID=A0A0D3ANQ1_BRAOL